MTTVTVTVYGHCVNCDAVYPREGYVTYRPERDDYLVEPCDPQHVCDVCGAGIEWKGSDDA